jgi:uncharacterized membrane protein YkvA (DUF1232 family)
MYQKNEADKLSTQHGNEAPHREKPKNIIVRIISSLTYGVLVIYYALQASTLSVKDKAKIIAALAYLVFPLDLIPDAIPLAGILDDGALLYALFRLFVTIDDSVKAQARAKVRQWFG